MILSAAVLGWLALLPGLVDATCLVITPYVMEVTSTTAIIRWETDQATTGRLCYKPAGDPGGAWMMSEVGAGLPYPTTHAANVFGLAPETTYEYKVLTQDAPGASDCESDASLVDCASVAEDTIADGSISQSSLSSMNYLATMSTTPSAQSTLSGTNPTIDERDLLPFKCRREYLSNRLVADGFTPDPFLQFELDLIALLPAACDGEAPVDVPPLGEDDHTDANDAGGGNRKLLQAQGCGGLTQTFKTSPVPGQCGGRFRSWWLGDSGKVSFGQTKNLEAAMAFMDNDWDGTFAIGDNAYNSGTYTEYKDTFFTPYCQPFSHVGLYPTLGNHDVRTSYGPDMSGNFFDFFVPGLPAQRALRSHYSYQHGRVHVVMLDLSYSEWVDDTGLYAWLEDDLSSARESGDIDWILVANHYPSYSRGYHDSDIVPWIINVRENMVPIFEKHGVDVSLSGHSHAYERSHLIHGHHGHSSSFDSSVHVRQAGTGPGSVFTKPRCGHSGVVHVVTGNAAKLDTVMGHHPAIDVSRKVMCTVVIHIEGTMLVSTCVGADGQLVDRFTIVKEMDPSEGCPAGSEFGPSCESYPSPAPTSAPPTVVSLLSGLPSSPYDVGMTGLDFLWLSTSSPPPGWTLPSFDDFFWSVGQMPAGFGPDYAWATVLPSNGGAVGSYLFRRTFCLTQEQLDILRAPESSVTLYIAADDRGSMWLNGESIFAEGGLTNHEMDYWNRQQALTEAQLDLLVVGVNLLAVEVTNTPGSSDAGFDGDLRVSTTEEWPEGEECDLPRLPHVVSILSGLAISDAYAKTDLEYQWLSTSSPPPGWASPSFDDSSWSGGLMPAGYGSDYTWATVLPSNGATLGSYLFRRTFCLTQDQLDVLKSAESSVTLYLAADDRGSVWLNGEPIFAEGGSTNHEMVYWNEEKSIVGSQLDLLEVGENLLAVEVTNTARSSDAGFDGDLRVRTREEWPEGDGCAPPLQTVSIISGLTVLESPPMTGLQYLWLSTSSPPPDWALPSFDDSSWSGGLMPAGYGPDHTWATALPSNRAKGGSYLFRRAFCLTQDQVDVLKSPDSSVTMYIAADNRGSVWLNGELIFAEGVSTNHDMVYWNQQQPLTGWRLDLLEVGVNLLAVEVTNNRGSSDAGFDGDLRVITREEWPEEGDCDLPALPQIISILNGIAVSDTLSKTSPDFLWLSTSSPPPGWTLLSFDDSSWSGGLMPAGYGPDHTWATALPSNGATGGSYLFRRTFCLTQDQLDVLKAPESSVTLYLAAAERGSVWLNGELIFAEGGLTKHEMVYWNEEKSIVGSQLDLLVVGVNLLAVEVTNSAGSSDAGFDGDLRVSMREEWPEGGDCDLPSPLQAISIISGRTVSDFLAKTWLDYLWWSTPSPPSGWASPSFDDSWWSEGLMPAGYGRDHAWVTVLPSNRATGGSYLFRRTFCLTQDQLDILRAPESSVTIYLAADDRGSVWLNGELVLAEVESTNHEMMYWNRQQTLTGSQLDLLVAGENLVAFEVTNKRGSSDAGFDGDLRVITREQWPEGGDCDLPAPPQTVSILSGLDVTGSTTMTGLQYLWLSTSSPPPDWALRSFDDSPWSEGPMPAGYGPDHTWATALPSNRATGGSYLFRRTFCLTQDQLDVLKSSESSVTLYLAADNRGSVWLNGESIFAEGLLTNHEMQYWNRQHPLTGPQLDLLETGENILAVEVTNDKGSSDAGFDGDLRVSTREEWPEGGDCDLPPPLQTISILSGLAVLDSPSMTGLQYLWLSTSSPPPDWALRSLDDSSWSEGPMPAGYGPDHTWATALPSNRATGGSYLFRRRFCLTQDQVDVLKSPDYLVTLYFAADNRASVWLNGEPIFAEGGNTNHEMVYWNQQQPLMGSHLDLLEAGENLLAVEVTNDKGSSDAGFDGDLRVRTRQEWPEGEECDNTLPFSSSSGSFIDISALSGLYAEVMAKAEMVKGHVSELVESLNSASADPSFLSQYELAESAAADSVLTSAELGHTLADDAAVSAATMKEKTDQELGDILSRLDGTVSEAKIGGAVAMTAAKAAELAALARDFAESVASGNVGTASTVIAGKSVAQLAEIQSLDASVGSVSAEKVQEAVSNNIGNAVSTSAELVQTLAGEVAVSAATIKETSDDEVAGIEGAVAMNAAKAAQMAALARDFAHSVMAGDAADKGGIASPVMTGNSGVQLAEIQSLKASVESVSEEKVQEAVGSNLAEAASNLESTAAISAREAAKIATAAAVVGAQTKADMSLRAALQKALSAARKNQSGDNVAAERSIFAGSSKSSSVQSRSSIAEAPEFSANMGNLMADLNSQLSNLQAIQSNLGEMNAGNLASAAVRLRKKLKSNRKYLPGSAYQHRAQGNRG